MKTPKIGDKIYVDSKCYISHGSDDVVGGLATVTEVDKKYGSVFVTVKEQPGHSYNWDFLKDKQKELKKLIKEIVKEVNLDNTKDYTSSFVRVSNRSQVSDFKIDNMEYRAAITETVGEDGNVLLAKFSFINVTSAKKAVEKIPVTDRDRLSSVLQWTQAKFGLTKTGKQMRVFNQVYNIFIQYIKKFKPKYVGYRADEKNRQKLYNTLTKRAEKQSGITFKKLDKLPLGKEFSEPNEFYFEVEY